MKFSAIAVTFATAIASSEAFVAPSFGMRGHRVSTSLDVSKEDLMGVQDAVDKILDEKNCGPVFVRLAWHDSGTYDDSIKDAWPAAGGAIGSIRFAPEINHGANAGLAGAAELLEPVKKAFPDVSYADIYQLASARAIELAGGPKIDMKYGRVDATGPEMCSPEGNLPDAEPGADGNYGCDTGTKSTVDSTPNGHLRKVFYRMGLNDEEIVALSGAHTFGRAYKDRSGLGAEKTKFTDGSKQMRADGKEAKYTPGGSPWVERWLIFDNSYFTTIPDASSDPELLKLSSDKTLFDDDGFKPFAEKFRDSQDAFFESYAKAHKRLSELGSKFEPSEGVTL
jgi:L-ascorbate peroxidase